MCAAAARGCHIDVLEWLHTAGIRFDHNDICTIKSKGRLTAVKWLYKNGYELHAVQLWASQRGHLDILKWLYDIGKLTPTASLCTDAAYGGHLETLQWLYSIGCPCEEIACAYAVCNGHLETVKWLCSIGCICNPIQSRTTRPQIIEWAKANGYP